jgi:autotransporter-associated beta strand protein
METFTFIKRAFLTLTIALMSISGAMYAADWTGNFTGDGITYTDVTLKANITVTVSSGQTCTVTGNISGNYKITKAGSGKLLLLGSANSWTGGLDITAGTVSLGDDTHAGTYTSTTATNTNISIASGSQLYWYVHSGSGTTYSAYCKITGSGYLRKYGAGELYFQRDMSGFTGTAYIYSGYLWITANTDEVNCTLYPVAGATVGFFNGATSAENIDVKKGVSGDGNIRVSNNTSSGAFNVNLKAASLYDGVTYIQGRGGLVCLGVENSTGYRTSGIQLLTANSEFVWRATGDYTLDMPITGTGNVQKVGGTGSLTMKKAQYSGYTSVLDGWVYFDNCAPSGDINFFGNTDASVGFIVDGTSNTITYSKAIISGGTNGGNVVSKQGTGTLILTSTGHTFTARTEVYDGVLQVNGKLGTTSRVDLKSSTAVLRFNPVYSDSGAYIFDKVISGSGKVEKTGTTHDVGFMQKTDETGSVKTVILGQFFDF